MPLKPSACLAAFAAAVAALAACGKKGTDDRSADEAGAPVVLAPQGKVLEAAENEAPPATSARAKAASSERVDVPAGKFVVGSTPGDRGRDPVVEPAMLAMELGGFTIDRYLYPNDPSKAPMTGVTRARAGELCEKAGGRLCTDLEWERACKGPGDNAYAVGPAWDAACAKAPETCASGFGVLGMGGALREWTSSDIGAIEKVLGGGASVRGARGDASDVDHRCAHRAAVDPTTSGDDIGFRCCRGPKNAAQIPTPKWDQTYRRAELTAAQVSEMLASVPQLKALAGDVTFFKEDDAATVLGRGDAGGPPPNTTLTTSPLLWNPVPGEEILVVAGRAQKDAFVVALYRLPGERYRLASSFIMKDEKGPVALGFNGYVKRRLQWGTCWDCRGESGNVTYRDDNRVVITQK